MNNKEIVYVLTDMNWFKLIRNDLLGKYRLVYVDDVNNIGVIFDSDDRTTKLIIAIKTLKTDYSSNTEYYQKYVWNRLPDLSEMMITLELGIFKIPRTFFSNNYLMLASMLEPDKEYYVKGNYSARSMAKYKGKRDDIIKMLEIVSNAPIEAIIPDSEYKGVISTYPNEGDIFNKIFDIDVGYIRNEKERYMLYSRLKSREFHIQEAIDVKHEFRILATYNGNVYIEKREGYGYKSKEKRKHTPISIKEFEGIVGKNKARSIIKESKLFVKKLKYPIISMDVWIDKNDDYGIFEWSSEFGLEYPDDIIKDLEKNVTLSIVELLDNE